MSYALESIATQLKDARAKKGISQRALADIAGVPQSHISKIEQGAVDIRLSSLLSLAHALDLDVQLLPKTVMGAFRPLIHIRHTREHKDIGDSAMDVSRPAYRLDDDDD